jgi:hypothetical protein
MLGGCSALSPAESTSASSVGQLLQTPIPCVKLLIPVFMSLQKLRESAPSATPSLATRSAWAVRVADAIRAAANRTRARFLDRIVVSRSDEGSGLIASANSPRVSGILCRGHAERKRGATIAAASASKQVEGRTTRPAARTSNADQAAETFRCKYSGSNSPTRFSRSQSRILSHPARSSISFSALKA